jgi:hypothetical protein
VAEVDFDMFRGETKTFVVVVRDEDGVVVPITGAAIYYSVKKNINDTELAIEKKNSVAGGADAQIEITDDVNGEYTIKLLASDSQEKDPGPYCYDSEVVLTNGNAKVPVWGLLNIKQDVGRQTV